MCNEKCVDVQFDNANCGACNKKCGAEDSCESGTCNGIDACNACAADSETGACKSENDACPADPVCKKLETCLQGCADPQCQQACGEGLTQEDIDLLQRPDLLHQR